MDKPIVITDVLNTDLFCDVHKTMHKYMGWKLNNWSYGTLDDSRISWGLSPRNTELIFYQAASIIKLKVLKHIRNKIQLCKIHYNGQTSGQVAEFHSDFNDELSWTFILFTELEWDTEWGGEFVSQHPKTKEYFYTPYIPNTGALIPAWWQHCGHPPLPCTDKLRSTIAFSYMDVNQLELSSNWDDIKLFV